MTPTPEATGDPRLEKFVEAQRSSYAVALAEITRGRKTSHWMWYVFPQVRGLGQSPTAVHYAIADLDEARAYLADPVLGERLREITRAVIGSAVPSAETLLGGIDAMKLRSSMTLFLRAAEGAVPAVPTAPSAPPAQSVPSEPAAQPEGAGRHADAHLFRAVLEKYYDGRTDDATDRLLREAAS